MTTKTQKTLLFASILAILVTVTLMTNVEAETTKDYRNYEAESIMKQLAPYIIQEEGQTRDLSADDVAERDRLQNALEKSEADHRAKFANPELKSKLLDGKQKFLDSKIPFNIVGTTNDNLVIQLPIGQTQYESTIAEILRGIPYSLEYGDGIKRGACNTTHDDCDPEIGGIEIQIKKSSTTANSCTLSIPMKKGTSQGFLTAGHCFTGYSETVYQPNTSSPSIGYSSSSWREYGNNLDCDCAWIKDTSATTQQNGIYVYSGAYWTITGTKIPAINDQAMLRGQHNNNGNWWSSNTIDVDNISISQGGIITLDTMGFVSPFQGGDSGGSVFYNGKYLGIAVATGYINGAWHTFFIPWDNINSSISGLSL